MKYKLTTSIFAKCRLLTPKVNFVVTIAYCCAFRAVYFITQRAEAPFRCYAEFLRRGINN